MPRDVREMLRETAARPTRPVDQTAVVRRAVRQRGARWVAASALAGIVVLGAVVALPALTGGPGGEEVFLEPAPSDPPTEDRREAVPPPEPEDSAAAPSPERREPRVPRTETAPPPPEPEDPTVGTQPVPAPDVVTEDEDGATLIMRPGDTTALRLSNDWQWEQPHASGGAVTLAPVDYFADPGYVEWQVEAATPGRSEITVAGAPACDDEAACPPRTVTLTLRVERPPGA